LAFGTVGLCFALIWLIAYLLWVLQYLTSKNVSASVAEVTLKTVLLSLMINVFLQNPVMYYDMK